jgi:hypothetical protein
MLTSPAARIFASGVVLAGVGLPPAASLADTTVVGSDLSRSPDTVVQHGADTAVWNITLASGASEALRGAAMPSDGQIIAVRLKGTAQTSRTGVAPLTQVHFQDLVAQSDGSVIVNASSGAFDIPASGDPNQVSEFHPEYFCVRKGDYVAFNDEGGFDAQNYPNGVAYQVLAKVPGSVADEYTKDSGTLNGSRFVGTPRPDQELLQQEVLATGPDALPGCPGGTKGRAPPRNVPHPRPVRSPAAVSAVTAPKQTDRVDARRFVRITLTCHPSVPCDGSLTLRASSGNPGGSTTLGARGFHIPAASRSKVKVRLSRGARNLLRQHRSSLPVQLTVSARPGETGPDTTETTIWLKRSGPN